MSASADEPAGRAPEQSSDEAAADRLGKIADALAGAVDSAGREGAAGAAFEGGSRASESVVEPSGDADVVARGALGPLVPGERPEDDASEDDGAAAVERAARALAGAGMVGTEEIESALTRVREQADDVESAFPPGYQVLDEVGRGGGGVVYRARQRSLGRLVALKVLHASDSLFASSIARFEREARALARLSHPGIVAIHEVGSTRGRLWYAMDLVEGRSLAARLRRGPLAAREAAEVVRAVVDAVAYVHSHGLVHRDLKPHNVLLGEGEHAGRVVVTDFGLALEVGDAKTRDGVTLTGQVLGTPAYMAPEQARGDGEVGPAADVYALGAILYEALSGRRPFEGLSPPEQVYAAIHQEPRDVRRSADATPTSIPEGLARIVEKAMRKRPRDRYPTARALVEDLDRFLRGEPVAARPRRRWRRVAGWAARHRVAVLVTGLLVGCVAIAAVLLVPRLVARAEARAFFIAASEATARDPETAVRLFDLARSKDVEWSVNHRLRAAEAEVPLARRWIDAGRAEDVVRRIDARLSSLKEPAELRVTSGPLRWARALALVALGRRPEAEKEIAKAFDEWVNGWHERSTAEGATGEGQDSWPWDAVALLRQEAALDWLAVASPLGRATAWFEFHHVHLASFWSVGSERLAEASARDPRTLIAAIEAEVEHPREGPSRLGGFGRWTDVLAAHRTPAMVDALATTALDVARPAAVRAAAAALLAGIEDLPSRVPLDEQSAGALATFDVKTDVKTDVEPIVALWQSTRASPAIASLRARVDFAVALAGDPTLGGAERERLSQWIRSHAPGAPATLDDTIAWWKAHREDDPIPAFAKAAGLSFSAPVEAAAAIEHWARASDSQRIALHRLLLLLAPPDAAVPTVAWNGRPADSVLPRWRVVFGMIGGPYRLRLGKLRWTVERGWHLDGPERRLDLDVGKGAYLHEEGPLPSTSPTYAGFSIGTPMGDPRRLEVDVLAKLEWKAEGLTITVPMVRETQRDGSRVSSVGGGGNSSPADTVFSPDLRVRGGSTPDPRRNELFLAVVESRDADATPWTLDAWRARVAQDLRAYADEVQQGAARAGAHGINRAIYDRQGSMWMLAAIASRVPIPGAVDALTRIPALLRDERSFVDEMEPLCLRARLVAGDADLLASPDPFAVPQRRGARSDVPPTPSGPPRDEFEMRREAQTWIRTLCDEVPPRLRAIALERLASLSFDVETAGDLRDAVRAGKVDPTPALRRRLEDGPTEDRSFLGRARAMAPFTAGALLLDVGLVVALATALLRRRRPDAGLVASAWLVLLGVIAASTTVVVAGVDLLPDAPVLALAALGAASLASHVRGAARWTAAVALAAASLAALVPADVAPALRSIVAPLGVAIAVAWAPWLALRLRGTPAAREVEGRPAQPALLAVGGFFLVVIVAGALSNGIAMSIVPGIGLGALAVAIVAFLRSRPVPVRASASAWPAAFVVLYVIPMGALFAGAIVVALFGLGRVTLRGDWLVVVPMVVGGATLWALLRLLQSARVRAAWERSKTSALRPGP